jgi:hypothetical protein
MPSNRFASICMHHVTLIFLLSNVCFVTLRVLLITVLFFTVPPHISLVAYSDADWAGCPDTRRSTSGLCMYLGDNLISWSSRRQTTVSCSSVDAEYCVVATCVAESCWVRQILQEMHRPIHHATIVYCDNVSAVYMSANPVHHRRTKHTSSWIFILSARRLLLVLCVFFIFPHHRSLLIYSPMSCQLYPLPGSACGGVLEKDTAIAQPTWSACQDTKS